MLVLAQSCTGQNPAPIKNSTTSRRRPIKASCSSMKFEGQLLSKKNILNVFDCSGWAKQYPKLNQAIVKVNEKKFDDTFKIFNETFFSSKERRKSFYEVVANSDSKGELWSLSYILEKGLSDHKLLSLVNSLLNSEQNGSKNKSTFLQVASKSQDQNLASIRTLKNILQSYEFSKPILNSILSDKDKRDLPSKIELLLNDLSQRMDAKSWNYLSEIVYKEDSPIHEWAIEASSGDLRVLLDIIEEPSFKQDVTFLEKSIHTGIECRNQSSSNAFMINVGQELKHKIEGLKFGTQASFEELLLHGLTKFLAFQEFCEEKDAKKGLNSLYMILKHAFKMSPSIHDFNFLKKIHRVFGEDRFVFLSFLTSDSFSALRSILLELKKTGNDEQFVRSLYEVLSGLTSDDLQEISKTINEISLENSQTRLWFKSWSRAWINLSRLDKEEFIKLLALFLNDDVKASDILNILEEVLLTFPDFSDKLYKLMGHEEFHTNVLNLAKEFSEEGAQSELSSFFSKNGLFDFIDIMTQEYLKPVVGEVRLQVPERVHATYVERLHLIELNQTRVCFESLSITYDLDSSYYNLVNSLPDSCLNVLGRVGFVGQIYLWMNSSDQYLRNTHGVDDFHSGTGVWSPGMLQFLFSAGKKADLTIENESGSKGILNNVDEIHRVFTDTLLLEMFHQSSVMYGIFNQVLNFDSRLLQFIQTYTDSDFNLLTTQAFKILKSDKAPIRISVKETSCTEMSEKLGVIPCVGPDKLVKSTLKIFRVLKRKNEEGNSLIKSLVKWIHPDGGIQIPFNKVNSRSYKASIDETIRFLFDLSSQRTIKPFVYQDGLSIEKVEGTVIDRVEVVIRDISFENNFYGAYFKNMVSSVGNYRQEVSESEKLLKALDLSSGVMRKLNALPRDSKFKLKNVRETFGSLIELADSYPQANGTSRSYDGYIQSLLAAVTESSKLSTQNFNAYRVPNDKLTVGHNGEFLTEVVKISGLRLLSSFVRSHFDENLSELNTPEFQKINRQLLGRHDLEKIQNALQLALDKYLDNDRNQINILIDDAINFFSTLSVSDQKEFEEIMLKILLLLSDERLSTMNIEALTNSVEALIQAWPEVRQVLIGIESKSDILKLFNKIMNGITANPDSINEIINAFSSAKLLTPKDLKPLFESKGFRSSAVEFLNQLVRTAELKSELNWIEAFETIFAAPDMKWSPFTNFLEDALGQQKKKLTLSLLISILGEKHNNQYRLQVIMDELFLNHRQQLNQFLSETFKSLEFKTDQ